MSEEEIKKVEKFRKLNQIAYRALLYAVEDEISFNAVDTGVSREFPRGCAKTAWEKLRTRWEPSTMTTVYELESKFAKMKLTDASKNPEEWITELEQIRNRIVSLKVPFSEARLIGHILTNLPSAYDSTVEAIQREMIVRDMVPSMEDILVQIRTKFKLMEGRKVSEENETVLLFNQFKGRCHKCGEFGHKAVTCKKQSRGNENRGIKCHHCGKIGHRKAECWKLHGRTGSSNKNEEKVSVTKEEHIIMAGEMNKKVESDFWLLDSGATSHITNSMDGMLEVKEINTVIKIGDGSEIKATKEGLKKMLIIQEDNSTTEVTMQVKYVPQICMNILSLNRLLERGFRVRNEKQVIIMERKKLVMKFRRRH